MKTLLIAFLVLIYQISFSQTKSELQDQIISLIKNNEPSIAVALDYEIEFYECRMTIRATDKADNSNFFIYRIPLAKIDIFTFTFEKNGEILMKIKTPSIEDIYFDFKGNQNFTNEAAIPLSKENFEQDSIYKLNKAFRELKKLCIATNN